MDNKKFIEDMLPLVGGKENIKKAIHCHTRLRLTLYDYSVVDKEGVRALEGVMTTKDSADQFQIVIGDKVKDVYNELMKLGDFSGDNVDAQESEPKEKKKFNPISAFAETMSAVFTPLIIAICGSGLMTGIQILLLKTGIIMDGDAVYTTLAVLGDTAFYFLPFMVAISAADRFNCNKYMAVALVGVLMHPTWLSLLTEETTSISLFGVLPIRLLSYSSSVIPPLLSVYLLSKTEKILTKIVPASLNTVLVPFLEIGILGPLVLIVIGPFSQWASDLLANGYASLYAVASIPASILFGALYPLIVLSGTHLSFVPLMLDSIAKTGVDYIMPLMSIAHCGLAAASLAVYIKTKNPKFKSVAATGAIVTGIGLTEPALYGVALPLKKPLIISCICSGIGGAFYGLFNVSALSLGLSPLGSIPLYFTDTFVYWVIGAIFTAVIAFVGTWIWGYKAGDEEVIPQYRLKTAQEEA
ncbi:PTS transporter subunit EIIC [Breznakia pachnodae]|uniref:PTS system beta-glucosides-specific IIC component n=1 Tax=Breznakia pachnodae TaxID=265178 RepID=A0ABU0E1E8_9FIRM|nr:PTS transporter subunit EIIC [Breznakia pachnodae]MDQ0360703.1 PTS system beta-glucosides-specific IIC component [Breznakia pachnodae]